MTTYINATVQIAHPHAYELWVVVLDGDNEEVPATLRKFKTHHAGKATDEMVDYILTVAAEHGATHYATDNDHAPFTKEQYERVSAKLPFKSCC